MTFTGPLFLLSFYSYVCFASLAHPPLNGIIPAGRGNARWVYYAWFIVAIFALGWAQAGLANVEATALMVPRLAPKTATELMWHTDNNWANPLWWLRCVRSATLRALPRKKGMKREQEPMPNALWILLSMVTLLLFVALPLSGLTMDIAEVLEQTDRKARIYGPGSATFNQRSQLDFQQQIYYHWQSGRATSPRTAAILYAPHGTPNASTTYFDDEALAHSNSIHFFAGPAVQESVAGIAWGLSANISCNPTPADQLKILQIHDLNDYSIKSCVVESPTNKCDLRWASTSALEKQNVDGFGEALPLWFNETALSDSETEYSLVVAADGFFSPNVLGVYSPYTSTGNHDEMSFDSIEGNRDRKDVTTSILEIFLWEGSIFGDEALQQLTAEHSDLIQVITRPLGGGLFQGVGTPVQYAGIGVHCDVTTAVGKAELDPSRRTFSSFERGWAISNDLTHLLNLALNDVMPPQILAISSLSALQNQLGGILGPLSSRDPDGLNQADQNWIAAHAAINSAPLPPSTSKNGDTTILRSFHALTPDDLQLAMYKLLGESVIAMMDQGGVDPWIGDLNLLAPARYLIPGAVSCIPVFVLLSLWTLILCGATSWMVLLAGPRWAPSLSGFEMFKFGAQYTEEVDDFETVDFQGCNSSLKRVPGMVGMLPGVDQGIGKQDYRGFIGLSENIAEKGVLYSLDRKQAAASRTV